MDNSDAATDNEADDDDEQLLSSSVIKVAARGHSDLLVDPTFSFTIFFEQLLIQMFSPLSIPFVYVIHGRKALVSMRFVAPTYSAKSIAALVLLKLIFLAQLGVMGYGILSQVSSSASTIQGDTPLGAFRLSLGSELMVMLALALFQRGSIAVKYAYLPKGEYRIVMSGAAPSEKMNDDQLLSAWVSIPPRVLDAETKLAAARIGVTIDGVHAHLSELQHKEIMQSICSHARRAIEQDKVRQRRAKVAGAGVAELLHFRGYDKEELKPDHSRPAPQLFVVAEPEDGGTPSAITDEDTVRKMQPPKLSLLSRFIAMIDMFITMGNSTTYSRSVGAWQDRRRQQLLSRRLSRRQMRKGEEGEPTPGQGGQLQSPALPLPQPQRSSPRKSATFAGDKAALAAGESVMVIEEDIGGENRFSAISTNDPDASSAAPAPASMSAPLSPSLEDDPIGSSSTTGGSSNGVAEDDEDLGFLRSPSLREKRTAKMSAYDLARAVLADADAQVNRKLAPRLFRVLGLCSLFLALVPTLVRAAFGIPTLGATPTDAICVVVAIYSNAGLLCLLLYYLLAGVLDYIRRSQALKKLGEMVKRSYEPTPEPEARPWHSHRTSGHEWLQKLRNRRSIAPAENSAEGPTVGLADVALAASAAAAAQESSAGLPSPGADTSDAASVAVGATTSSARIDQAAALTLSEALAQLRLRAPALSLDTVGNVRAWLTARRLLQSFGLRFFRRIQVLSGAALVTTAAYAFAAVAVLVLSHDKGYSLIASVIVAVHAALLLGTISVILFIMLNAGAEANRQSDEHSAILAARKIEALQALATYEDPVALAHADATRHALLARATLSAASASQEVKYQRERLDVYMGLGGDAAGLRARALAEARASRWRNVSNMLDGVIEAIAFDRRLEPLTILGVEATEALASWLLATVSGLEAGLAKIINDRFNVQGALDVPAL